MKCTVSILLVLLFWATSSAQTYTVINTNNSGTGSLRDAINKAMTLQGATPTVNFNLPSGTNTITLSTEILLNTTIAGKTLTITDVSKVNPLSNVVIKGMGSRSINGFRNTTTILAGLKIYGLQFENFLTAVSTQIAPIIGSVGNGSNTFLNNNTAIYLKSGGNIIGNYIGTDKGFTTGGGNNIGIESADKGNTTTISNNYLCKNGYAIYAHMLQGIRVIVTDNVIGTNNTFATRTDLGNSYAYYGFDANAGTSVAYFEGNTIAYTEKQCLSVDAFEVRRNDFICNAGTLIYNHVAAYTTPVITAVVASYTNVTIRGTSFAANDSIFIFERDPSVCASTPCQGVFVGAAKADSNKQWVLSVNVLGGRQITAIATKPNSAVVAYIPGTSSQLTGCYTVPCPTVTVSLVVSQTVSCYGGNDGAARLTVTDNSGATRVPKNFKYSLIRTTTNTTVGVGEALEQTPIDLRTLSAGIYKVVITNSNNGCTYTSQLITITQPNAPLSISGCKELTPVSSSTASNAVGQVIVSGGTAPYSITVTRPNGTTFTMPFQTSGTFNIPNLAPGNYTVTAFDNRFANGNPKTGCTATCSFTINTASCTALKASVKTANNVLCNGTATGSLVIKYSDLTSNLPLRLTASNGFTQTISAFSSDSTAVISNLKAGTYTINLSNKLECLTTTSATITEPPALKVTCDTVISVKRVGEASGSAKVTLNGGQPDYNLSITGPVISNYNSTSTVQISITNLPKGNYIATVYDGYQCVDTCHFTILEPNCTGFNVLSKIDSIQCFGEKNGRISLTNVNGVDPINYTWSDVSIGNQSVANNLGVGNYKVTITDDRNCKDIVTETVVTPSLLTTNIIKTDVQVAGQSTGTIDVTVLGGTPSYNVVLTLSGNDVPLKNQTGNTFKFNTLPKGTYIATTTDARGCTKIDTIRIADPNCNFTLTGRADSVSCFGGNNGVIRITHNFPAGGVSYAWSQTGIGSVATATGLRAGVYSVTATTTQNCTDTLEIEVFEPDSLAVSSFPQDVTIVGGSNGRMDVSVSGGTQPYTVKRGATMATPLSTTSFVFNNLPKGTYLFTVTDAKGCSASQTVTINDPVCAMDLDSQIDSVACAGSTTGRISLVVNNSLGTLNYAWNPSTIGNTGDAKNLIAGNYAVTVTDSRRCTVTAIFRVFQPNALITNYLVTDVTTVNGSNGRIAVNTRGGTKPYSVRIDTTTATRLTDSTFVFNGLAVGNYTFTVTDAKGCTTSQTVTVNSPNCNMTAQITVTQAITCFGASDGRLSVIVQNAQTPQYNWAPILGNIANPTGLAKGTYSVTVTDARNCSATAQATLTEPLQVRASMSGDTMLCAGQSTKLRFAVQNATTFTLTYTNGVDTFRSTTLEATVLPTATTTYRLLSVQAGVCTGLVLTTNRAVVTLNEQPELATTQIINLDSKLTTALINTRELLKSKTIDPSVFSIKILKSPDKTRVEARNNGIYFDRNNLVNAQTIEIEFEICSKTCPNLCNKGKLLIVLQPLTDDTQLSLPKMFSVNSRNGSTLEINGLDFYLNNELTIVNRWGSVVFGPVSYKNNTPERSWDGKKEGKTLPTGAYYYFIKYKEKDILKTKNGIIYLVEEN